MINEMKKIEKIEAYKLPDGTITEDLEEALLFEQREHLREFIKDHVPCICLSEIVDILPLLKEYFEVNTAYKYLITDSIELVRRVYHIVGPGYAKQKEEAMDHINKLKNLL